MARDIYDISILTPGMPFDGGTLREQSLGGSESAALYMGRSLAKLGHRVAAFSNTDRPGIYDNVTYRHLNEWKAYATSVPHDIQIVQRVIEPFEQRSAARMTYWWCHDLALGRSANAVKSLLWNCDRTMVLSEYMRQQYAETYGLPERALMVTRNGVDVDAVPPDSPRRRRRLVYAARPERGLDVLVDSIMPRLLDVDPDFTLHIYGYDNQVDHLKELYAGIRQMAARFGDRIHFEPCLTKEALYEEYVRSGIYVYPTPSPRAPDFAEVYCISALEAQACGLPIVTSTAGALPETIHPGAGTLIAGDPGSTEYVDRFVDAVVRYAQDDDAWQAASDAGRAHARTKTWDGLAEEWTEEFARDLAVRNDDPTRLAYHFYRRTDIIAARHALAQLPAETFAADHGALNLAAKLDAEYSWIESPAKFAAHYATNGEATDARLSAVPIENFDFTETGETRFAAVIDVLRSLPDHTKILEYGCGHGWLSIFCHNKVGRCWTGIDVDPGAIKWANKLRDAHAAFIPGATSPSALTYMQGDEDVSLEHCGPFDVLIMSEVLEHCVDPVAVIRKMERWLAPGALVIITVPFGPNEYGTPNWDNFRNHLWEFDRHDIHDMLGRKEKLTVTSVRERVSEQTGEVIGYNFITYLHNPERPVGDIDMERKLRLQAPRRTISASLIAGPNVEETLLWCLRSLRWVTDEIIIGDTGMCDQARDMCAQAGARVVPAPNPLQNGFDAARNVPLAACSMDMVLWIDTDEKLIDPQNIIKYARYSNLWNGYSVRQHHFTCDAANFPPDMPVRLFYRAPYEGKEMRHIGRIHEHPELGLNEGPGPVLILPDVHIAHLGYLSENIRRGRFARNLPLLEMDERDYPDRKLQKHFRIRDLTLINMYQLQQNGGRVNEEIASRARRVIALYREHFLGQPGYVNADSLQYYSQALQVLNEGFDVGFTIGVQRDGQGDKLGDIHEIVARFATMDEARKEIEWRLQDRFRPLEAKTW